jgi:twitching motility protein PilT
MTDNIEQLLKIAQIESASDLHLNVDRPPIIRVDGKLLRLDDHPTLQTEDVQEILNRIAKPEQVRKFLEHHELDFSYDNPQIGRFRVNACMQKGSISLAFRLLMGVLSPLTSLGLPAVCEELSVKRRGLILVTGPTGSGKSTTMAAMIDHINKNQERHIITIEDPIEYVHKDERSVVIQRGVGEDTDSFADALKHALRHDPDVIVVGEMRDLTTIAIAITAAETGHLVFGTLHTIDASETIDRVVEVFPSGQQAQIRLQLSQVLVSVISQTLIRRIGGGRVPGVEIMICNSAIKNLIREGQIHQIQNSIQLGRKDGMQTMDQSLSSLVNNNIVTPEDAINHCHNIKQLEGIMTSTHTAAHYQGAESIN